MILDELEAMGAPRRIIEAGEEIQKMLDAKLIPSRQLVQYVQQWVGRANAQNRYGK